MAAKQGLNIRSSATKRILQEHREFLADPSADFVAHPLEEDIFEWHVTVRGVENSEYAGGIYHLRILLKNQYPMQAPDILIMTPQGRFEPNRKICIDGLTSFHEGSWRPAWGVRTAIVGLMSFWSQGGEALAGVGAMNCDKDERKRLAKLSVDWTCPVCQKSNGEIMKEHEEAMDVSKVEKFEKKEVLDKGRASGDRQEDKQVSKVSMATGEIEPGATVPSQNISTTEVSTALPDRMSAVPASAARRPATITLNEHLAELPSSPPFITRTLLKPPPAYLAPVRLAHYHLCKLFCPVQYREHMPPRPDTILWLDTLIFFIIATLLIIFMQKLARSWTRIVYVALTAVEKASGIDMSWITQRFTPGSGNVAPSASRGAGYHWTTGVNNNGGVGGDRTRLRNMDTAMRARDIARRFGGNGRGGEAAVRAARAGGERQPHGQVDAGAAAAGTELRARRVADL